MASAFSLAYLQEASPFAHCLWVPGSYDCEVLYLKTLLT